MFKKLKQRIVLEISHYQSLTVDVRHLLISYYLYLIAYPMFMLFTNAYLWRQGEDLNSLIIYNLFYCLGLPLGFYGNGLLLKHFHTLKLYALGGLLEGLAAVLIVFFPSGVLISLLSYGLLAGLGAGLYWGNKNYLSLRLTKGSNRLYYNTLESSGDMIINMIIPVLVGTIIVFGSRFNWYLPQTAYKFLMILALIIVGFAGYIVQSSAIDDLNNEPLFVAHTTNSWKWVRIYNILSNIIVGAEYIVPGVLVLVLVGKEGTLGLLNSATALLSAISLYVLGRLGNISTTWKAVGISNIIYLFGAILLAINFSPTSVLIYMTVSTIGWAFRWSPSYTVIMEIMDREDVKKGQYAYICDNEVTFNIGRIIGILLIFILMSIDQDTALRFTPLIIGILSLFATLPLITLAGLLKTKVFANIINK